MSTNRSGIQMPFENLTFKHTSFDEDITSPLYESPLCIKATLIKLVHFGDQLPKAG